MAASCSCEAPAASSAPAAICSIAPRSSLAAEDAAERPLASSSVAAATRSAMVSLPAPVATVRRRRTGLAGAAEGFAGRAGAILEVLTRAMANPVKGSAESFRLFRDEAVAASLGQFCLGTKSQCLAWTAIFAPWTSRFCTQWPRAEFLRGTSYGTARAGAHRRPPRPYRADRGRGRRPESPAQG